MLMPKKVKHRKVQSAVAMKGKAWKGHTVSYRRLTG